VTKRLPDHWRQNARQWQLIGTPLRPVVEDIQVMEAAVERWYGRHAASSPYVLLLGVTQEIARMRWPPKTWLTAVDKSSAMIRGIWPGDELGFPAVSADWMALPIRDRSQDLVIGDGSFNTMVDANGHQALANAIRRVLRPDGLLLMRFFLRPERAEARAAVFEDLWQGRIGNFHVFKWRFVQALQGDSSAGVRLADIWDVWRAEIPDPPRLARHLGWPVEVITTIDSYRGASARYTFPTLHEVRETFAASFVEELCAFPHYELGERCPTLVFRIR
jgi:SAM-dependent methyltransferase